VVERYLDCGNPRCGFARIRCPNCHAEHLLMFSCRTRGFWTLQLQLTKSSSKRSTRPPG
jgi:hypothetical protein